LTLGLGIGATTAIFSVVHAVVLKPHAYADPDRVLLATSIWRGSPGGWSVGNFDYFRQRLTSVEQFAASAPPVSTWPMTGIPSGSSAAG
jgi:putative ABC transport system permease protein